MKNVGNKDYLIGVTRVIIEVELLLNEIYEKSRMLILLFICVGNNLIFVFINFNWRLIINVLNVCGVF